jgi:hypothetical protein
MLFSHIGLPRVGSEIFRVSVAESGIILP